MSEEKSTEELRKENCELMDQVADLKKQLEEAKAKTAAANAESQKLAAQVKELKEAARTGGRGGEKQKNKETQEDKESSRRNRREQDIQDLLNSPPKKPTVGPEEEAKRAVEEKQLKARDQLRGATSAEELKSAIAAAKEAGLKDEVKLGEKKLAKLEAA